MRTARSPRHARGFSLLELAVALVISGAIGALLWRVLPNWRPASGGDPAGRDLVIAEQALQGFALASHRLPCPDRSSNGDGLEHCEAGLASGRLPVRTLGLPAELGRLRYGVHRGAADLTVAASRHVPMLPPGSSALAINGLDLCIALRDAGNTGPAPGFSVGGAAAAFALADPGSEDRDQDGDLFDGGNQGPNFALPGAPLGPGLDDRVRAVGFGELAVRLGCMQRLGIANGGARAAYAAYDEDRFAAMYVEFRNLAYAVRQNNTRAASATQALAIADMAIAVATSASAVALAGVTAGIGAGTIVGAAAAVASATATLTMAVLALQDAKAAEGVAVIQVGAALQFQARTEALLLAARQRATALDAAGLQP